MKFWPFKRRSVAREIFTREMHVELKLSRQNEVKLQAKLDALSREVVHLRRVQRAQYSMLRSRFMHEMKRRLALHGAVND